MARQIYPDLVLLEIPQLVSVAEGRHEMRSLTFNVESLLALTNMRESADQATRYTAAT